MVEKKSPILHPFTLCPCGKDGRLTVACKVCVSPKNGFRTFTDKRQRVWYNPVIVELCYGSGEWSKPWKDAGYEVIRIDIKDGKDVRLLEHLKGKEIYGILAGPPCCHLAGSGARWWKEKGENALFEALSIVDACLRAVCIYEPVFWCLENPVGRLSKYLGSPVMTFQPYEYGNPYQKRTCLWGNFNIPKKNPIEPIEGQKIWKMAPGPERKEKRSITPSGFAKAFYEANRGNYRV